MGKIKYINNIREFFKKTPVVNISSLKKFIGKKNKDYIYLLINNLMKKGEIRQITKGYYTIYEDSSLIVFCFKPSYLGLQNALSFHNLWEQETNPLVITTRNIRTGLREVFGRNVVMKRIPSKYFFGFDYSKDGDFYFPYSDIEKTFIDMIYFKQYIDKEVIKEFKRKIDKKKLNSYLKHYPKRFRKIVLKRIGRLN
jgi:predicted transcriptional regulator of viral defense system